MSRRQALVGLGGTTATLLLSARSAQAETAFLTWKRLGDLPRSVQEVYGAEWNGKGVIVGGMALDDDGRSIAIDQVALFDPVSETWSAGPSLPSPRHHPAVAVSNGRLYAMGGARHGLPNEPTGEHWRQQTDVFVTSGETWERSASLPLAQSEGVALAYDGLIHLITGRTPLSPSSTKWSEQRDTDFHQVFDPGAERWSFAAPAPAPRNSATGGVINGKLYIAGGRTMEGGNMSRLDMYDHQEDRWHQLSPMPKAAGGLAGLSYGGHLYAFGGEELEGKGPQAVIAKSWRYDPTTDRWDALADMLTPRHGLAAIALNDRIFLIGGGALPATGQTTSVVEVLTLSSH